jgi:hypothetical protein
MTTEQIAELRELERNGTRLPWKLLPGPTVAAELPDTTMSVATVYGFQGPERRQADALLIAAARNALPRLLDERDLLLVAVRRLSVAAQMNGEGWRDALLDANRAVEFAEAKP